MASTSGDLEELFQAEAAARGQRRARRWYRLQLLKALPSRLLAVFVLDLPMFIVALKIMFRGLRKHKVFSTLNLLALSLGLTCFFLIFLYVRYESTYDSFHPDSGRIYHLRLDYERGSNGPKVPGFTRGFLESRIPEVEAAAQTCHAFGPVIKIGKAKFEIRGLFAGEEFLRMFRFPLVRGENRALAEAGQVLLTESAARRLFGPENPVGQPLDFFIRGENCRLTLAGILADPPSNTHFDFEVLISYPTTRTLPDFARLLQILQNSLPRTYVKLRRQAAVADARDKIAALLNSQGAGSGSPSSVRCALQPISDVHLRPNGKDESDSSRVLPLFLLLSVLILTVGVINYVNLATSRSSLRGREIGIRKTIGARRRQLVRQFLGEAVILTAVSFLISLAVLVFLLPVFNRVMERDIRLGQLLGGASGLEAAAILLLVGAAAGFYPAVFLSSFRPERILRGAEIGGGGASRLRNGLVVVQFAAAVVLVVLSLFVRGQVRYILRGDENRDGSLVVETWAADPQNRLMRQRLLENPKVSGAALTSNQVFLSNRGVLSEKWGKVEFINGAERVPLEGGVFHLRCDGSFLPLFNIPLLAGRNFDERRDERASALVNETLARRLGPGDATGRTLRIEDREITIIGIVEDFHFQPFHTAIGPILLTFGEEFGLLYIKFKNASPGEALAAVKAAADEFFPDDAPETGFLDDRVASLYQEEIRQAALLTFFATLAVVIAGLGIIGLAAFSVERRTREMGIRKALGAGTGTLFWLLAGRFAGLLALALAVGGPVSFYFANRWMAGFAYHIPVRLEIFLLAGAGMMAMVLLTSGTQVLKIAQIDPAKTLRHE